MALDLPVLLAASAAAQQASPAARAVAAARRDQTAGTDRLQALAWLFAPSGDGPVDLHCMEGSFNALISGRLMVGQDK